MDKLHYLFEQSAMRHTKLCPRQILGVRMGLYGGKLLDLEVPQQDKRLFVFAETDGCGTGGVSVATNCWVDRRTMRIMDFGKVAATFVNTQTDQAIRIIPHLNARERAWSYALGAADNWHAMYEGYQVMPDEELFTAQAVRLTVSMQKIISRPGVRVQCQNCGESITNEREVWQNGQVLCRSCAGESYWQPEGDSVPAEADSAEAQLGKSRNGSTPLITVVGKSGAGKTTFLEKLIAELSARNYRIATVKHHSHLGFDIDVPGKDSWRHAQAGSRHVVIASPDKYACYWQLDHELELDEIAAGIQDMDLILVEGYKQANKPAVEVVRAANSAEMVSREEQRLAVITDMGIEGVAPLYDLNDAKGVADLIEARFLKKA